MLDRNRLAQHVGRDRHIPEDIPFFEHRFIVIQTARAVEHLEIDDGARGHQSLFQ